MNRLYIIDGHSLLYKAYYAIRGLSTHSGTPTNAVFGFVNMLHRVIRECHAKFLCVTFDSGKPSFRVQIYPEYKANRPEMPQDLQIQIPIVFRLVDAMGIKRIVMDGYEADDLIATLCHHAEEQGWETRIVTADKDLFQLVTSRTHVLRFTKDTIEEYDPEAVRAKMGVPPERIADLLGLMGDSTDNIPGISGIGPKTASNLLRDHGDLETVLKNAAGLKNPRMKEKLLSGAESARLSLQLATVARDIPLEANLVDFAYTEHLTKDLESLLTDLEFRSLLSQMKKRGEPAPAEPPAPTAGQQYRIIRTVEELQVYVDNAVKIGTVAIDTETTSLDTHTCALVGVSLSFHTGEAVYIPVGHDPMMAGGKQITLDELKSCLGPLLLSPAVKKCGHNMKFDIQVLHGAGFELANTSFDTMLASCLLNPGTVGHGLKHLAPALLGLEMNAISGLLGDEKSGITMAQVPVDQAGPYAALDADATFRLMNHFKPRLEAKELTGVFEGIEMPLVPVLARMEETGVMIDAGYFRELGDQTRKHLAEIERECREIAGESFNIGSPKQVAEILFEKLGLQTGKKGKSGFSTDVSVLQDLASQHPLPEKILEFRGYEKLLTTYIEPLPRQLNPATGRIHTSFIQIGAATGRLSSRDPNLQNIPVRTPQGRAIRAGFIPSEGHLFLSADYSQIELRILAHLSADAELIRAFQEGDDIHRQTAARIFGTPVDDVTDEMRTAAKTINFGVIYGMSAHRLAGDLKIPHAEASRFISEYFRLYSGVKEWLDATIRDARIKGYVKTLCGRRRDLPDLNSSNHNIRMAAERMAVNTPIQGTSADMIKIAMIRIDEKLRADGFKARMLIQVHDELIFEAPEGEIEHLKGLVSEEMEQALPLNVPIIVGLATGYNWAEC